MLIVKGDGPGGKKWTKFAKMTPEQFIAFQVLYNQMIDKVHGRDHNQLRWYVPDERLHQMLKNVNNQWIKEDAAEKANLDSAMLALNSKEAIALLADRTRGLPQNAQRIRNFVSACPHLEQLKVQNTQIDLWLSQEGIFYVGHNDLAGSRQLFDALKILVEKLTGRPEPVRILPGNPR